MMPAFTTRHWLPALALTLAASLAFAQPAPKDEYKPMVGQPGKDVVWVPTPDQLVDKMLDMAKVTPADFLMDLGSGDGRTVIAAAKRGVQALGVEYNPDMVALSRKNAKEAGVEGKASFVHGDIFETNLSKATVITLFLLPDLNVRLRPTLLKLKPGLRVVSNSFRMGDWNPDQTIELGCGAYCTAYLWIVPAQVDGRWDTARGPMVMSQTYQEFTGAIGGASMSGGKLNGTQISFTAGGVEYSGTVAGDTIEGSFKSASGSGSWKATRSK